MSDDVYAWGEGSFEHLWVLCDDRRCVRFQLPPLPTDSSAEPIRVSVEFDSIAIDYMLKRLSELRTLMLPPR
jgi:hypothetical protein